ncbi:MAG: signal peptidase I [Streptococcaceae bacterium]|nr:signal peptidase I [Streptococcaceae bacterium]
MSKRDLIQGGVILFIVILVWSMLRFFVFTPIKINDAYMQPFLMKDERILAFKLTKVKRFDVVAFSDPNNSKKSYVKRVIGLPGDEVHFMDDVLYINGNVVEETYLEDHKQGLVDGEPFTPDFNLEQLFNVSEVPKGKFFVLGDNRKENKDLNNASLVEKKQIIGEAKFAFWPFKFFGPITNSVEDSSAEIDLTDS